MSYSSGNSYEEILARCLSSERLTNVDKRVGSIIYDTLAPLCMELAEAYFRLDMMEDQSYLMTAIGSNLDRKAYDYGISRIQATNSICVGSFKKYVTLDNQKVLVPMEVPIGSRFSAYEDASITYVYTVIRYYDYETESYVEVNRLKCEQAGTRSYVGRIVPITPIMDLAIAEITSIDSLGADTETDEELRARIVSYINNVAFGGNIQDYIEKTIDLTDTEGNRVGVGGVKVYPAWMHGVGYDAQNGTVLLSVVDDNFNPITDQTKLNTIKGLIDPSTYTGLGYGIAPIGHKVTITTPVEATVTFEITVTRNPEVSQGTIITEIGNILSDYITSVRKMFKQDENLTVLRALVITNITNEMIPEELTNITKVLINGVNADVIYVDEAEIGGQTLPKFDPSTDLTVVFSGED